jgi:hypothetical protein
MSSAKMRLDVRPPHCLVFAVLPRSLPTKEREGGQGGGEFNLKEDMRLASGGLREAGHDWKKPCTALFFI